MSPAAAVSSSSSSAAVACDADPRFRLDFQRIAHALHSTTLILRKQTTIFFSNCCPTGRHHPFLVAWPRLFVYAYRSVFAIVT